MKKKKIVILGVTAAAAAAAAVISAGVITSKSGFDGEDYTIPELDLSTEAVRLSDDGRYESLYSLSVVDDGADYLAHPDSVLLKDGRILTVYPQGHGKGAILNKISSDGGLTWDDSIKNTPVSWQSSLETPTVYRLTFTDGVTPDRLVLISANPKWPGMDTPGGFECSVSSDEGRTWTEFRRFYDKTSATPVIPIVAMASLTQLKENGRFVDKWMGFFHDADFYNYKTILTFDDNGDPVWSEPEKYFAAYRDVEKRANMCEVEVIRSDSGLGDELCLIARSNSKTMNSLISFSSDEGRTWSEPVTAPAALNGERHKAEWTADGRLFITFRSIERGKKAAANAPVRLFQPKKWLSEGWVAWVGTFDDLKNGAEGQYRIKLAHIYLDGQTEQGYSANADTGYCGNVVLADGTIVTSTYGKFFSDRLTSDGGYKTCICSKRINLGYTDALVRMLRNAQS